MVKIRFTNREIALLALFSALWAIIEINLGLVIKMLRVPFSGALLTFLGLMVIFMGILIFIEPLRLDRVMPPILTSIFVCQTQGL